MKIRNILFNVLLCSVVAASSLSVHAESVNPDDIRDGVVNVIDSKQIADLLVWANGRRPMLEDGLKRIDELPRSERHQNLRDLVDEVIGSSGDLGTELLMRSVLKRARYIDDILNAASKNPERETLGVNVLEDSARWAITLYQSDEDFLQRASAAQKVAIQKSIPVDLDFTSLGIQHGKYILDNLWMSPSLTTRIVLVKESLSYFFNDLNRDNVARRNPTIANVLMKIANFAEKMGLDKSTADYLKSIEKLTDLQKQDMTRKIEAFYKEQLNKASTAQIERASSGIVAPIAGGGFSSDSAINAKFVYVRPGRFLMGSPLDEVNRGNDEQLHEVILTKGFSIQQTDVTQSQWWSVMGNNPSKFKSGADCSDHKIMSDGTEMCPNNPVEQVTWNDVQDFISRLNQKAGAKVYRLPTEAEWEYSARGGTTTAYSFGSGSSLLKEYAWYVNSDGGDSDNRTHPVCTKKPNPLGLCDMHGNVWQWVQDWYDTYPSGTVTDPARPSSGSSRVVVRGGSWCDVPLYLRAAYRYSLDPGLRFYDVGFRLVRASL
jgi:formylglycine-generating enzyme required for sulfatase activity